MGLVKTRRLAAMQGVDYTDTANWHFPVCKGLKQMGYNVDLNCLA
jgi:hypothetical protein